MISNVASTLNLLSKEFRVSVETYLVNKPATAHSVSFNANFSQNASRIRCFQKECLIDSFFNDIQLCSPEDNATAACVSELCYFVLQLQARCKKTAYCPCFSNGGGCAPPTLRHFAPVRKELCIDIFV